MYNNNNINQVHSISFAISVLEKELKKSKIPEVKYDIEKAIYGLEKTLHIFTDYEWLDVVMGRDDLILQFLKFLKKLFGNEIEMDIDIPCYPVDDIKFIVKIPKGSSLKLKQDEGFTFYIDQLKDMYNDLSSIGLNVSIKNVLINLLKEVYNE